MTPGDRLYDAWWDTISNEPVLIEYVVINDNNLVDVKSYDSVKSFDLSDYKSVIILEKNHKLVSDPNLVLKSLLNYHKNIVKNIENYIEKIKEDKLNLEEKQEKFNF